MEENHSQSFREKAFQSIMAVLFMLVCFLCVAPVLNIMAISLSSKEAVLSGHVYLLPSGLNTLAYRRVLADTGFMYSFTYSIGLTALYTALSMLLTILCAYPLSKKELKGRKAVMVYIIITMYFVPGIIPAYLNIKNLNLLDSILSLILPTAISAYNMIILRTFFSGIDISLFEAAYMDGAGEYRTLYTVAVPLATPCIATLALFYAVSRWNGVNDVLFYISDPKLYTVQLKLKQMTDAIVISQEERSGGRDLLVAENVKAASIVFSMVPMLILYPFIQKYFTKGIMLGAVKG